MSVDNNNKAKQATIIKLELMKRKRRTAKQAEQYREQNEQQQFENKLTFQMKCRKNKLESQLVKLNVS